MTKLAIVAGTVLALALVGAPVQVAAGPMPAPDARPEVLSLVESAATWRYRRDCVWVNGGWYYGRPGAYLACRPYKPAGTGWVWYSEGGKIGWYHTKRRAWHYTKW